MNQTSYGTNKNLYTYECLLVVLATILVLVPINMFTMLLRNRGNTATTQVGDIKDPKLYLRQGVTYPRSYYIEKTILLFKYDFLMVSMQDWNQQKMNPPWGLISFHLWYESEASLTVNTPRVASSRGLDEGRQCNESEPGRGVVERGRREEGRGGHEPVRVVDWRNSERGQRAESSAVGERKQGSNGENGFRSDRSTSWFKHNAPNLVSHKNVESSRNSSITYIDIMRTAT